MKFNWKIALLCFATIAMIACKKESKNEPSDSGSQTQPDTTKVDPTDPPVDPPVDPGEEYVSPISIKDKSIADWDKLDPAKVAIAELPNDPLYTALKKIMVYADNVYINYVLIYDPEEITSRTPEDAMHIYMDADNSDETGGYFDQFDAIGQGNTDLMFEGSIFDEMGAGISYNPSVSAWAGELHGEGWEWELLPSGSTVGASQFVEEGIIEGRLIKQYIPWSNWTSQFSIGFDMQQNWESVGLLPQGNSPDGELIGRAKKLLVTFDK